jgi:hypothetical protein
MTREIMSMKKAKVYILNPRRLYVIWKTTKKTDAEDALKLARLGLRYPIEELPLVPLPTAEEEKLREVVRETHQPSACDLYRRRDNDVDEKTPEEEGSEE